MGPQASNIIFCMLMYVSCEIEGEQKDRASDKGNTYMELGGETGHCLSD